MIQANAEHVARRLQELLSWADYMVESLSKDQLYEKGKVEELRRLVGDTELGELRQAARTLREKLALARVHSEHPTASPVA